MLPRLKIKKETDNHNPPYRSGAGDRGDAQAIDGRWKTRKTHMAHNRLLRTKGSPYRLACLACIPMGADQLNPSPWDVAGGSVAAAI